MRYLVFQREVAPSTGREHWQGFLQLANSCRWKKAQEAIGDDKAHIEIAADPKSAAEYCKATEWKGKDKGAVPGTMREFGTFSAGQGSRNDLIAMKDMVDNAATDLEIWDEHFASMLRYHKGLSVYRSLKNKCRDPARAPTVYVLTGPPGTGKSRWWAEHFAPADTYVLPRPSNSMDPWWDGYQGQSVVVLDDFYGWIKYSTLLNLLDRYPMSINIKGQALQQLRATTFVITSNQLPDMWYKDTNDISALRRRLYEFAYELRYDDDGAFQLYDRVPDIPAWTRTLGPYVEPQRPGLVVDGDGSPGGEVESV